MKKNDREKIVEMGKILCKNFKWRCYKDCEDGLECEAFGSCERLYEAGYRKASEVAREIFEDIENVLSENFHADCIMGDCVVDYYDDNLRDDIAELKKKYGGTNNDGE